MTFDGIWRIARRVAMRGPGPLLITVLIAAVLADPAVARGETYTVRTQTVPDRKAVFARVESVDTTQARTRIAGTIEQLAVDEGDHVDAGARIARVVDPKLGLEIAALDSRIGAARAEVKLARIELARTRTLRQRGTVSESALDAARTKVDVAEGTLAALQAERQVVAERQIEGDVLAPTAGRVLDVPVTDARVVQPGEVIATIACDCFILRLHLPERHARFIHEGDEVMVGERGLAVGDQALRVGQVRQVYPQLDNGRVVADVDAPGLGDYFIGERTRVYVATGQRRTFVVPAGYVFSRAGVSYVWVRGTGSVAVQRGQTLAEGVEILSGVRDGDVLVRPGTGEAAALP